jgi:hypothetical protein
MLVGDQTSNKPEAGVDLILKRNRVRTRDFDGSNNNPRAPLGHASRQRRRGFGCLPRLGRSRCVFGVRVFLGLDGLLNLDHVFVQQGRYPSACRRELLFFQYSLLDSQEGDRGKVVVGMRDGLCLNPEYGLYEQFRCWQVFNRTV